MTPAPVALFAYKRPAEARQLLASLAANPEIGDTQVYAFCDGARGPNDVAGVEATRAAIRQSGLPRLEVVERERNVGLSRSIVDGVTRLCAEHGRAIVLEDDLVLSPRFLAYMNDALARYEHEPRVCHVSGYTYPVDLGVTDTDAVFLPFINSTGWATWQRAWRHYDAEMSARDRVLRSWPGRRRFDLYGAYRFSGMLERQIAGEIDSWAIRWYLSVFARDGLALYPVRSLVANVGISPEATNSRSWPTRPLEARAHDFEVARFPPEPALDERAYARVRAFLRAETGFMARVKHRARVCLGR